MTNESATGEHNGIPTLESLLGGITPERFLAEYFGEQPLRVANDDPTALEGVLRMSDMDDLTQAAIRASGNDVSVYARDSDGEAAEGTDADFSRKMLQGVHLRELVEGIDQGNTIRLEAIQNYWKPAQMLVQRIQAALGCRGQCNLYLTPPNAQGLATHFDTHDVLVLQIQGDKHWRVWDRVEPYPFESEPYLNRLELEHKRDVKGLDSPPAMEFRLATGDVFYLPGGFPHMAKTQDALSVHLTIGFHPISWADVVCDAVQWHAATEPKLRRAVTPAALAALEQGNPDAEQHFFALMDLVRDYADLPNSINSLTRVNQVKKSHPLLPGPMANIGALRDVTLEHSLRRPADLRLVVQRHGDTCSVHYGANGTMGAPLAIFWALQHLRDHEHVRVGDLPGPLDDEGRIILARRLLAEGVVTLEAPAGA